MLAVNWSTGNVLKHFVLLCTIVDSFLSFQPVNEILVEDGSVVGVKLEDDSEVRSSIVLSNATPHITYMELLRKAKVSYFSSSMTIYISVKIVNDRTALQRILSNS